MKSVMLSIQPKWCELIASGKKTVELRKTRPKLETPFKCYIYCTNNGGTLHSGYKGLYYHQSYIGKSDGSCINGKVIGEFICDDINTTDVVHGDEEVGWYVNNMHAVKGSCLDEYDILNYCPKEATIYGWHISDLVIYDKPRELSEFCRHDNTYDNAFGYAFEDRNKYVPIKRPPQSWCYVEEGAEGK